MAGAYSLGDAILSVSADTAPLKRQMLEAESLVSKSTNRMQSSITQGMGRAGSKMQAAGGALTKGVTLPIVGIGVAAAKSAADFQSSMELIHTQAGAPQKEITKLKNQVLDLAQATGQSPQALSQALYHLESIGLRGNKAMSALKASAEAASTGMASIEDAATALGGAFLVGIKGGGNFNQIMGTLNATIGTGNMRMGDLITAMGTGVLAASKIAGISLQNVMGAMAVLSDEGWKASSASARLGTALHFLYAPSTKAKGALADIGLSQKKLVDDLNSPGGLMTALADLKSHLDALPGGFKEIQNGKQVKTFGAAADAAIGKILPSGQGRVMLVLMNQLQRYDQKVNQIYLHQGDFQKDFAATTQTATFKIRAAWDGVQAQLIKFGDDVLPTVTKVLDGFAGAVESVGKAFQNLSPELQKQIVTGGLIVAGIGPAMKIMGLFTSGLTKLADLTITAGRMINGGGMKGTSKAARQAALTAGTAKTAGVMEVASMEVAEMIVRSATGMGAGGGAIVPPRDSTGKFVKYDPKVTARASGLASDEPVYGPPTAYEARQAEKRAASAAAREAEARASYELPVAEQAAGGGFRAGASELGGRVMGGAGIGIGGYIASQLAGTIIGGGTGSAVKKIGGDASIGAGLGSLFGPEGTAGGAILGGLVGTFSSFANKDATDAGKKAAAKFSKPFHGALTAAALSPVAAAAANVEKARDAVRQSKQRTNAGTSAGNTGRAGAIAGPGINDGGTASPAAIAALNRRLRQQGVAEAKSMESGLQSVKLTSSPVLSADFLAALQKMNPKARQAGAAQMLQYAQGLKNSGKLPAQQFQELIRVIESQVPGLTGYLKKHAPDVSDAISHGFDEKKAIEPMVNLVKNWKTQSGDIVDVGKVTGKNVYQQMSNSFDKMRMAIASSTGKARQQYVAELQKMQSNTQLVFKGMSQDVQVQQGKLTASIVGGSLTAANQAGVNMGKLQTSVHAAMAAGVLDSANGSKIISDNLNQMLSSFGAKKVPLAQLVNVLKATEDTGGKTGAAANAGHGAHAGGGMVELGSPGEAGHDTIQGVVGDQPFRVAPGETVAVLNRHQRPVVDMALAGAGIGGGLGGLFATHGKANYAPGYAKGGFIPGFDEGGVVRAAGPVLLGGGFNKTGAAGVLGNAQQESSWNPATTDGAGNGGLWGFTASPNSLAELAAYDPNWATDPAGQARFLLMHTTAAQKSAANTAGSPSAAAVSWMNSWEHPRADTENAANREAGAVSAFQYLNGVKPGPGGAFGFKPMKAPGALGGGAIGAALTAEFAKQTAAANAYAKKRAPASTGGGAAGYGSGAPTPMHIKGPLPPQIKKALQVAEYEVARHVPYGTNEPGDPGIFYGLNAPSLDCSGYVSTILNWAGIGPGGHLTTWPFEDWGVPGPGKYLTVGVTDTGSEHHMMVEIANRYFESSGHTAGPGGTNLGPHEDSGWVMPFNYRHWPGLASGGLLTDARDPKHQGPGGGNRLNFGAASGFGMGVDAKKVKYPKKPDTKGKKKDDKKKKPKPSRAQQLKAIALQAKKDTPKFKKVRLPKMAAIPGFQTSAMAALDSIDTKVGDYGSYLSYLDGMFGVTGDVQPLIDSADGSTQTVNWGTQAGPSPSGMIDPQTGQPTKGIYDRLREIGAPGERSKTSLLGVQDMILDLENSELSQAQALAKQLNPWLGAQDARASIDDRDVAWLGQALDLTQPMPKVTGKLALDKLGRPIMAGKGLTLKGRESSTRHNLIQNPLPAEVIEKVMEYRNAQATIDRWEDLRKEIPALEKKRGDDITNRFATIRKNIESKGAQGTFTAGELLDGEIKSLEDEKHAELDGIPTSPPAGWKGDRNGWYKQHEAERARIESQYDGREQALRDSQDKSTLSKSLKKAAALATAAKQERSERSATETSFENLSSSYEDLITDEGKLASGDKSWLTSLKAGIKTQGTGLHELIKTARFSSSGAKATLDAYLDPMGQLNLSIDQTRDVDIPTLRAEANALNGTIVPPSSDTPTDNTQALLDIQTQLATQAILGNDVGASQAAVLAQTISSLPPYIGAYEGGLSRVPGPIGQPWSAVVHGGEQIVPADGGPTGGSHHVIEISKGPGVDGLIDCKIRKHDKDTARRAGRNLPSRGGGIIAGGR